MFRGVLRNCVKITRQNSSDPSFSRNFKFAFLDDFTAKQKRVSHRKIKIENKKGFQVPIGRITQFCNTLHIFGILA